MSGGRKAQANGAALERHLVESCAWLGARSRCVVERKKPPYKHLGQLTAWLESHGVRIEGVSEGLWVGLYSGESSVDFEGDVRGGSAVAFDADRPAAPLRGRVLARLERRSSSSASGVCRGIGTRRSASLANK